MGWQQSQSLITIQKRNNNLALMNMKIVSWNYNGGFI